MTKSITLCAVRIETISAVNSHLQTKSRDDDSSKTGISGNGCSVTFKRGTCPLPPDAFHYTQITRALNMLPVHQNSLAIFLFSDDPNWSDIESVAKETWATFEALQEKKLRVKKKKILQAMIFLAMQEYKCHSQTAKHVHTPTKVTALLGINEHHWHRDWYPFWKQMYAIIDDAERKVLEYVYEQTISSRMDSSEITAA